MRKAMTVLAGIAVCLMPMAAAFHVYLGNERQVECQRRRAARLRTETEELSKANLLLARQANALEKDPFVVEALLRGELGWERKVRTPTALVVHRRRSAMALARRGQCPGDGRALDVETAARVAEGFGFGSIRTFQRAHRLHVTGRLDRDTKAALGALAKISDLGYTTVKRFQLEHGLVPDGIVGRQTILAAKSSGASATRSF